MNEKNLNGVQIQNDIINLEKPFLPARIQIITMCTREREREKAFKNASVRGTFENVHAQCNAIRFDLIQAKTSNHSDTHLTSWQYIILIALIRLFKTFQHECRMAAH